MHPGKIHDVVLLKWKNRTTYKMKALGTKIELMLIMRKYFSKDLGHLLLCTLDSSDSVSVNAAGTVRKMSRSDEAPI